MWAETDGGRRIEEDETRVVEGGCDRWAPDGERKGGSWEKNGGSKGGSWKMDGGRSGLTWALGDGNDGGSWEIDDGRPMMDAGEWMMGGERWKWMTRRAG